MTAEGISTVSSATCVATEQCTTGLIIAKDARQVGRMSMEMGPAVHTAVAGRQSVKNDKALARPIVPALMYPMKLLELNCTSSHLSLMENR